jgi:hypothetical protein
MKVFKVIFARNEIISCSAVRDSVKLDGSYHYEHKGGKIIYALIKAETEEEACSIALTIRKEVSDKIFGSDYITV